MTKETKQPTYFNLSIALSTEQNFFAILCEDEETAKALELDKESMEKYLKECGEWDKEVGADAGILDCIMDYKSSKEKDEALLEKKINDQECICYKLWDSLGVYFLRGDLRFAESIKENKFYINVKAFDGNTQYSMENLQKWLEKPVEVDKLFQFKGLSEEFFQHFAGLVHPSEHLKIEC